MSSERHKVMDDPGIGGTGTKRKCQAQHKGPHIALWVGRVAMFTLLYYANVAAKAIWSSLPGGGLTHWINPLCPEPPITKVVKYIRRVCKRLHIDEGSVIVCKVTGHVILWPREILQGIEAIAGIITSVGPETLRSIYNNTYSPYLTYKKLIAQLRKLPDHMSGPIGTVRSDALQHMSLKRRRRYANVKTHHIIHVKVEPALCCTNTCGKQDIGICDVAPMRVDSKGSQSSLIIGTHELQLIFSALKGLSFRQIQRWGSYDRLKEVLCIVKRSEFSGILRVGHARTKLTILSACQKGSKLAGLWKLLESIFNKLQNTAQTIIARCFNAVFVRDCDTINHVDYF